MHQPGTPDFVRRVWHSFQQQTVMTTFGATLALVAPGLVTIVLPFREDLTQQDGYLHAGVVTTLVDSACGYAALTLMPAEARVLTVEFKANFVSPAEGELIAATGHVVKAGRTLSICVGKVVAHQGAARKPIALMQATMIAVVPR